LAFGNANAAWIALGEYAEDGSTIYADPTTLARTGAIVRMGDLTDFKTMQFRSGSGRYLSVRTLNEYDCDQMQSRLVALSMHSGNMANGDIIFSNDSFNADFRSIAPYTSSALLQQIACDTTDSAKQRSSQNSDCAVASARSTQHVTGYIHARASGCKTIKNFSGEVCDKRFQLQHQSMEPVWVCPALAKNNNPFLLETSEVSAATPSADGWRAGGLPEYG
jgi:hypothetical protein